MSHGRPSIPNAHGVRARPSSASRVALLAVAALAVLVAAAWVASGWQEQPAAALAASSPAATIAASGGPASSPGSSGGATPGPTGSAAPTPTPSPTPRVTPPPQLTPDMAAGLTAAVASFRSTWHLPGVQVAIRVAGRWAWSAHAGVSDRATRQPVTSTTLFGAGSITKAFVAALVVQLADQHVLGLGDPLDRWLPGVRNARGVTIRELLDHTSGIDDAFGNEALLTRLGAHPRTVWSPDQVLRYVKKQHFPAGDGWYYSNSNYLLLGRVVEAATGRTVASLLRERFLVPLGLSHTFLQGEEPAAGTPAHGYDFTGTAWRVADLSDGTGLVPFTALATAIGSAGAIVTTADDLARWAEALYGRRLLSPTAMAEMLDFDRTRALKPRWPYGLGVQRVTIAGRGSWGHSGLLSGFRATMRYFPADGLTIAVMTNANGVDPDRLVADLLAVLVPPAAPVPNPSPGPGPVASPGSPSPGFAVPGPTSPEPSASAGP